MITIDQYRNSEMDAYVSTVTKQTGRIIIIADCSSQGAINSHVMAYITDIAICFMRIPGFSVLSKAIDVIITVHDSRIEIKANTMLAISWHKIGFL